MKTKLSIFLAILSSGTVINCSNVGIEENIESIWQSDNPLLVSEVSIPVKSDPSFNWTPQSGTVDLGALQSGEKEPVLLTIGTGTAAGYRDGGLTRQGQLTSYPNLVARQMGLKDFNQAVFDKENGNGTGYYVRQSDSELPSWSKVTNNLAYIDPEKNFFAPYSQGLVHNLSVPGNHPSSYQLNPKTTLLNEIQSRNKNPLPPYTMDASYLWTTGNLTHSLLSRIVNSDKQSVWAYLNSIKPNVAIVDINADVYIQSHIQGGQAGLLGPREVFWELNVINYLKKNNTKYVYATIPDVLDFPYFNWYNHKNLSSKLNKPIKIAVSEKDIQEANNRTIFLPTRKVIDLFNGNSENEYLTDLDIINEREASRPELYNNLFVAKWAKEYNHPLVDFYAIYKKILSGKYVTDDGYKIDPSYSHGNFFSADGIYPSAIGQAVLANEVIKVLNASYQSKIPLIDVGLYAKEMEKVK
jgi:hypothetical protein